MSIRSSCSNRQSKFRDSPSARRGTRFIALMLDIVGYARFYLKQRQLECAEPASCSWPCALSEPLSASAGGDAQEGVKGNRDRVRGRDRLVTRARIDFRATSPP